MIVLKRFKPFIYVAMVKKNSVGRGATLWGGPIFWSHEQSE
jgi:hypothetical protein